ncbi:hypothetical protein RRG08_031811 [Elysia crispata]|uniref:Uncharacterized protein n=1 Tax=Elysia crispata TaxID=231223 RepID=A0AAE1CT75_9GAST|nr:hypothetical protein RRG08_031811 [Elysia crispata]
MEVIRASLVLRAARTCGYSSLLVLTLLALSRHRAPCLGPAPAIASPTGSCQSKSGMLAAPSNNSRSVWREWSSLVVNGTRHLSRGHFMIGAFYHVIISTNAAPLGNGSSDPADLIQIDENTRPLFTSNCLAPTLPTPISTITSCEVIFNSPSSPYCLNASSVAYLYQS